jgi:hypothetical protein
MKKMKKTIFATFVALVLLAYAAHSQDSKTYKVGDNVISAGIGLGSSIGSFSYGSQTPGLSAQYERGCWNAGPGVISLGGYFGIKSFSYDYSGYGESYQSKWNYTIVGVRGAYHYTGFKVDKLDVYGGLMLSYDALSFSESGANGQSYGGTATGSTTGLTAFIGGRYYFAGNLAGFAELGYGVSYLNLGLAYKF